MEDFQKAFARALAETGALFFAQGLRLKDGRSTPYFVNLGLFRTGRLSSLIGVQMARMLTAQGLVDRLDVLVGPSYKGSALAVSVAQALWSEFNLDVPFDYDRKEAKTHGEASGRQNQFVTNALTRGARVFILDDVGTSMATKYTLIQILNDESAARNLDLTITGVGLAVDREQTTAVHDEDGRQREGVKGDDAIGRFTRETGIPVYTLVGIKAVVRFLAAEKTPVLIDGAPRPIDPETLARFEEYMAMYGVEDR